MEGKGGGRGGKEREGKGKEERGKRGVRAGCANGFVLPVNVPLPLNTKSVIYCTATSGTATRVSVAAFSYAEA